LTRHLAVDIGGTFVDAVAFDDAANTIRLEKSSTTPQNPTTGVLNSIEKLGIDLSDTSSLIHGTTLGLNAVLEREGTRTGIITNEGFKDVFEIGRYDRPADEMYTIPYSKPSQIVPRQRRYGVPGRMDTNGNIVEPLDEEAVREAIEELTDEHGVESIAICFLHSYQNPEHERRVREIARDAVPDVSVSISTAITNEYREFERTGTTVLDAYIKPIFESYVDSLLESFRERGFPGTLFITRSGGGAVAAENAKTTPVHTVMSGPAGGLIGASRVGRAIDQENLITADMGGTSLDACVIQNGSPNVEFEYSFEHLPMMIPVYDIRTIGAGGGSIAWIDENLLKVGPKSAGADPGPICYDRGGTQPTITDAALTLGMLSPDNFLGGEMDIDAEGAKAGIEETIADPLGMTLLEASKGILDIALASTVSQIREITVEKGLDPRDFSLIAFGGAGPMFIPLVAREMGIPKVIIPQAPSVFSAWGMLMSDVVYDYSATNIQILDDTEMRELEENFERLEAKARETLESEGFTDRDIDLQRSVEMRYFGQEHTVSVQADEIEGLKHLSERFEEQYINRYGHAMEDPPELVHQRVRGIGETDKPEIQRRTGREGAPDQRGSRRVYCFAVEDMIEFDVRQRENLASGDVIEGPAIIEEPTSTTVFYSDQTAEVDEFGHLVLNGGNEA